MPRPEPKSTPAAPAWSGRAPVRFRLSAANDNDRPAAIRDLIAAFALGAIAVCAVVAVYVIV